MSEEKAKLAPGFTEAQMDKLGKALVDGLVKDLEDPKTRTASAAEVARKLLRDNGYGITAEGRKRLDPLTRTLPPREGGAIPPLRRVDGTA